MALESKSGDYIVGLHRCDTAPLSLIQLDQPPGSFPDKASAEITIQLNVGAPIRSHFDIGGHRFHATFQPEQFIVTPAHEQAEFVLDDPNRPLIAAVPAAALGQRLGLAGPTDLPDLGPLHEAAHADRRITAWMRALWAAHENDPPGSSLLIETGAIALTNRLLQLSGRMPARDDLAPVLAPCAAGRVFDYIEAHLADTLHLETLARVACVSEYHFLRAFKAATGTSPHQYVLRRRVAAAKQTLAGPNRPITDIALATGFASHAHLCTTFKTHTGSAPGSYQRAIRA